MANFLRLLLGGVIALGAILVTLLVGALVVIGTMFGLVASRFRNGGAPRAARANENRAPNARRRSPAGGTGTGDVIDVEVTDVTETQTPATRLRG
jgi:hypothetical protein